MFSVSKSVTSLAIGILLGRGMLSLEDPIIKHFPEMLPAAVPGPLARTTIRDMLRMATCHSSATYHPARDDNWARTFFTVPPTNEPDAVFAYDTSASQVLAALAEKLTGMPLLTFLEQNLFAPIGANGPKRWLKDPSGVSQGGTGLLMTLRDLHQIALFCMGNGGGIVPADYLKAATAKQTETLMRDQPEETYGYGYQFWRTRDGFSMYGLGGQLAICVPDKQLCLCTTADTQLDPCGVQRIYDAFFEEIAPCMASEPDSRKAAGPELSARLAALSMPVVLNHADCAQALQGIYRVDCGTMCWKSLKLERNALSLTDGSGWKRLPFGIGEWIHGVFPATAEPCVASAGWAAPGNLKILCHVIGDTPCGAEILLSLNGHRVTVQMKRVNNPITEGFAGVCSGSFVSYEC
jgi:hypothetical protein